MAVTRAIPLNTNTSQTGEIKNYLTDVALSVGDWLELTSAGKVQKASRNNSNRVVGVAAKATTAGSLQTIPVQVRGNAVSGAWNFPAIGQPVYISSNGGVTQNVSAFAASDYLIEVGIAIGGNQIAIDMKTPVLLQISATSALALASKVVYAALETKANLDPNGVAATGVGTVAVFTSTGVLAAANDLQLPAEGGTILTNRSTIVGSDYD